MIAGFVEMGTNEPSLIQTRANDLAALKRRFGRSFVLQGGVDTQWVMTMGTPQDVRKAALWAMYYLGREGGLILEPDQRISMPDENVRALQETARAYGRYPLSFPPPEGYPPLAPNL